MSELASEPSATVSELASEPSATVSELANEPSAAVGELASELSSPVSPGPVHLVGGGWDTTVTYAPFLADASRGHRAGPAIACVVFDEGDGERQFDRWSAALRAQSPTCRPRLVPVRPGEVLDVHRLGDADGLLVCGGLTPGYADALVPVAAEIIAWLADGHRPYCGFSAGAAIASRRAIVGGWRAGEMPVCPEDAAEDLDQLTVMPGLGLTRWSVDVHCAQWGTLPRLIEAVVGRQAAGTGLGIDENTVVSIEADGRIAIAGTGRAWFVHRGGGRDQANVSPVSAGTRIG